MMAGDDRRSEVRESTADFGKAPASAEDGEYALCLRAAGMRSIQAIDNIKRICEEHLSGWRNLEIIDTYQQPLFARDGQIVAAPTTIKELSPLSRKLTVNMSNTEKVLIGMDLICMRQ